MKLGTSSLLVLFASVAAPPRTAHAFSELSSVRPGRPAFAGRRTTTSSQLSIGKDPNVVFGGNSWKPDSETMGSTDTGDYFPEGYDGNDQEFTEGMMGSQAGKGERSGPQLPGMENLGADAFVTGGIATPDGIPDDMEFVPSSVPDGEIVMQVSSNSGGGSDELVLIKPVCMTFEDYYAHFSADSHPSFSVSPPTGRMDRRGGEMTELMLNCDPKGHAGTFTADLVINLPEDNSKICYKITANCF